MIIETERLILRHWQKEDLAPFAELNACPKVCEFLLGPMSKDESDAMVDRIKNHFSKHGYGLFAVERKDTKEFIGFTGLSNPPFDAHFMPAVEIGWRLALQHHGKGFATEAATAAKEYAFNTLNLKEIVSFTVIDNLASRRVMEKIGMTHDECDDFDHPILDKGHKLSRHALYRLKKD